MVVRKAATALDSSACREDDRRRSAQCGEAIAAALNTEVASIAMEVTELVTAGTPFLGL